MDTNENQLESGRSSAKVRALPGMDAANVISSPRGRGRVRGKGAWINRHARFYQCDKARLQFNGYVGARRSPSPCPLPPGEGVINLATNFTHVVGSDAASEAGLQSIAASSAWTPPNSALRTPK